MDIRVLVVEDSLTQALELQDMLEQCGFKTSVTHNGKQALGIIHKEKPDIVISDIMMPEMDGYELCRRIKADDDLRDIPVVLLTFLSNPKDIIRGLECGADSFLIKPCEKDYILSRIQYIIENWQPQTREQAQIGAEIKYAGNRYFISLSPQQILDNLLATYEVETCRKRELIKVRDDLRVLNAGLEEKVIERTTALTKEIIERKRLEDQLKCSLDKLQITFEETVQALASISEKRDPYTAGHQQKVAELACAIAREMRIPDEQIKGIYVASLLHDIGKVFIPAEILSKPGSLTEQEFNLIKGHPGHGYDVLKAIDFPWPVADIVLQHHERIDGSGYPVGLRDEQILLEARILAVADVVEAMASHRPYRPAHGLDKAIEEISINRGTLYDPEVVDSCIRLLSEKRFECA